MASELLQNMMKLGGTTDSKHASKVLNLRPESANAYSNLKNMFSDIPLN